MLQLKNITKTYGNFRAVSDLSFDAEEGKIVGLIGPNGAGKSTTIRMIMNILEPDCGEILINGKHLTDDDSDRIGFLPEERGLYKKQKVCDMLYYLGALKGMTKDECNKQIDIWLKKFGLSEWKNKKIDALSKGMSQKIQFISAVMHSPDILFLDEPFSGLDPVSSDQLLSVIKELKSQGRIILFSTHVMETAEIICDHIIMINKGQKILDGSIADIKRQYGSNTLTVSLNGDHAFMKSIPGVIDIVERGNEINVTFSPETDTNSLIAEIASTASKNGCVISGIKLDEPSLHSIFVSIAGTPDDNSQSNK
ncbi:MAG: ATP-binding cassette domain-containing protein [Bacteroidales bacterium]|nr:ATP-binding cassette domain-containing protein [Bacteroidales bacterium]